MSEFKNLPSGWKVVRLGEIAKKSILKNRNSLIKLVLSNSAINGLVAQNEYFDKDIANKENIQDYYVVDIGDFVYNPRISQNAPTGPINRNMLSKGIVSPLYTVFSVQDETLAKFLAYFFKTIIWQNEIKSVANYGARHDRINITDNAFFSLKILLPPLDEQEKIAEILSTWDEAINLTINLIENKKQFKKALMQNLLTAKIRFPEFQDEWLIVKLEEVSEIYQPQTISQSELTDSGFDVYDANGIIGKYSRYNHEFEQVVITCRGNTCGAVNFTKPKSWITGNAMVINLDNSTKAIKTFIYYLLSNTNFQYLISGSGQPQITSNIRYHKIKLPNLDEQQKIAEVLTACDDEINLLNLKLENLKKQKQGLMQKLLSAKVRVK